MRAVIWISTAVVAGCAPDSRVAPDAPMSVPDAPSDVRSERKVNQVVVGDASVFWSHGEFVCSLEFGCPTTGPGLTLQDRASGTVSTLIDGGAGARPIAGTEDELFVIAGSDYDQMYLRRLGGAGPVSISLPRPWTAGPALDATHVYWADSTDPFAVGYTLRRASRTGNGEDASTVATVQTGLLEHLVAAGGFVWWLENGNEVVRVAMSGGVVERTSVRAFVIAALDDVVHTGNSRANGDGTFTLEIGRFAPDGSHEVLVEQLAEAAPRYIARSQGELFWSTGDGRIYHAVPGSSVQTINAEDRAGHVFAVLPDRIFVEFTRTGFRTIAR